MDNKKIVIFIAAIFVISLTFSTPVVAKDPLPPPSDSISITNGIISIPNFGETFSNVQYYPPTSADHLFREEFAVKAGGNPPVWALFGTVTRVYPLLGTPDVWYHANVEFDLDGGGSDINVTRSIMVPSGQKYFVVKYCIENIKGTALPDFKFYQYADYDVELGLLDEGGYDASGDFVWSHDLDDTGITYVGFSSSDTFSSKHASDSWPNTRAMVMSDSLDNSNYYAGDVEVALEWDLGELQDGETQCLTVKFAFADSYDELKNILALAPVPILTPIGLVALVGLLSGIAAISIRKRKR